MASDDAMSDAASDASSSSSDSSFDIQLQLPYFTPPSRLSHFWTLPRELQHRVIALACGPPAASSRNTIIGRSVDDTTTILRLIQTSRFFYAQTIPLLYANVRITRPSTLLSFHKALALRPSLGQIVRRLHIGADEALPDQWFPVSESECGVNGHFSLRLILGDSSRQEPGSWIGSPSYECHLDELEGDEPKMYALIKAVKVASKALDVNFLSEGRNDSGDPIDTNAWHIRVLELQAAMELYYLKLQRCDERAAREAAKRRKAARKTKSRTKETELVETDSAGYPRLRSVSNSPKADRKKSSDAFCITRAQIRERMTSAGAPTHLFSHPLLFARSDLDWLAMDADGEVHRGNEAILENEDVDEISDVFSGSHLAVTPALDQKSSSVRVPKTVGWDPLNLASSSTATVGGNLALARCILSLTPHVRSLSLTGIFEKLLRGITSLASPRLRSSRSAPQQQTGPCLCNSTIAHWGPLRSFASAAAFSS